MTAVRRVRRLAAPSLISLALLLTGCAAPAGTSGAHTVASKPGAPTMAGMTGSPVAASAPPPATAQMMCSDDIKSKVVQVLKLSGPPKTVDTWAAPVYTCTYSLPMGQMVLSVAVAPDKATAGRDFDALPSKLPGSSPLNGLGERSQGTPNGTVEVLKDNQILTVDTTALPAVFGPEGQKRTDLAYEIASDVLGCWTSGE